MRVAYDRSILGNDEDRIFLSCLRDDGEALKRHRKSIFCNHVTLQSNMTSSSPNGTSPTTPGKVVVIGGTSALGKAVAKHYADRSFDVIVTSRSLERAQQAAIDIGGRCAGLALDLAQPQQVIKVLGDVKDVQHLVLAAVVRNMNSILQNYDIAGATDLIMVKTVGYQTAIHALVPNMRRNASICLFGGLAKDRPYPGSTMVTTANGAVHSMVHTLAIELAQAKNIRVNAVHPGLVGDSPHYVEKPAILEKFRNGTPLEDLVCILDVVEATVFLLENRGLTGVNLPVNAGYQLI